MSHPVAELECTGTVSCVEFSPYHESNSLLAFSSYMSTEKGLCSPQITIAKFSTEDSKLEVLKQYHQDKIITCLSWSPQTFIESLPYKIVLCAGDTEGQVRLITSNLEDSNEVVSIGSHRKAVNAVCFDWYKGSYLASVGDDCRCYLWSPEGDQRCEFLLKSAGVDVQFYKMDDTKLVVGERCGLIRFYDLASMTAFMSLECGASPLKSLSWSHTDITQLHALVQSSWLTFNTLQSCYPVQKVEVGSYDDPIKCGTKIRACESSDPYIAVACGKGNHVKVFSTHRGDKILQESRSPVGVGFSWHQSLPLLLCGGDRKLVLINAEH